MKTPLRTLKLAFTGLLSAFALAAHADTTTNIVPVATANWSSVNATDIEWSAGSGSTNDLYEVNGSAVDFDTGDDTLSYSPTKAGASTTPASTTVSLQFNAAATAPATPTGAQTAITVFINNGVTNYYVYAGDGARATNPDWTPVPTLVPDTVNPVEVTITLDYAQGKAFYVINGVNAGGYYLATNDGTQINTLNFAGSGSLSGDVVTKAAAAAAILSASNGETTYYETVADAESNFQTGDTYYTWSYANGVYTYGESRTGIAGAVTVTVANATYTGSALTPAVTVAGLTENTDFTVDSYANNINAGTGTVTLSGIGNYIGTTNVEFTIAKAEIAVPTATSYTYDGTQKTGVPAAPNGEYTLVNNTATVVGNYTATATLDSNHAWTGGGTTTPASIPWAITPRALEITAGSDTKVYDGAALTASTYQVTDGSLASGDTIQSVACSGSQTTVGSSPNAASAAVIWNANNQDVSSCYNITYKPGTLEVTEASMTLTVSNYSGDYDGSAHTASATCSQNDAAVLWSTDGGSSWSSTVPEITNVGTVSFQAKASKANYSEVTASGTLEVTAKAATITVDDDTKTFGAADPTFTGTVTGLVGQNDLGTVTYSRPGAGTDENVGTYADAITASYTANANYSVTVNDGDFEITKKAVTYTASASIDHGTDASNVDALLVFSYSGWVSPDNETVLTTTPAGTVSGYNLSDPVGTPYQVTITQSPVADNYSFTFDDANSSATIVSKTYNISFVDSNGTTPLPVNGNNANSYEWGTAASNITAPTPTPPAATAQYTYTFDGWDPALNTVTQDQTYRAKYKENVNSYRVRWYNGDGVLIETDSDVPFGDHPDYDEAVNGTPSKADDAQYTYTFVGWTNATVTVPAADTALPTVGGDTDYFACFDGTLVTYTIMFVDWDGAQISSNDYAYGSTLTPPAYPTRQPSASTTYTCTRWDSPVVSPVVGAATYTAVYDEATRQYTITFVDDGGATILQSTDWPYNGVPSYTNPAPIRVSGSPAYYWQFLNKWIYEFDQSATVLDNNNLNPVDRQAKYYAQWEQVWIRGIVPCILTNSTTIVNYRTATVASNAVAVTYKLTNPGLSGSPSISTSPATSPEDTTTEGDVYTTTFSDLAWNQAQDWTITATVTEDEQTLAETLAGRAYAKSQTEWFTKAANALDEVDGFGDDIDTGVNQTNTPSASGQMVRINTRLDIGATAATQAPEVGSARGGFAVLQLDGDTEPAYYAFTGDTTLGTDGWVKLSGATPAEGEHDVLIAVDTATDVAYYYVDGASLSANITRATTFAIPVATGETVSAIGFSNPDGVKSAVVGEYDVPYVAAIGTTGYTTPESAVAAANTALVSDDVTLTLLAAISGEIAIPANRSITIAAGDNDATGITFAAPAGYRVADPPSGTPPTLTYTVELNNATVYWVSDNGAVTNATTSVAANGSPAYPQEAATPTKATDAYYSYEHDGWSETDGGDKVVLNDIQVTAGQTYVYYAHFAATPVPYTLTINYTAPTGFTAPDTYTAQVGYGASYSVESPAVAGCTVAPATVSGTMPAEPVTVAVAYTAIDYTITWTDNSGTVKTETLHYGDTPTAPAAAPVQYVDNGTIYTGTWPTPSDVTGNASYAANYTAAGSAVATVLSIADNGDSTTTTNALGTYASLKAAVAAAPAGSTVVLLADDTSLSDGSQLLIDKAITIDGDGHTVYGKSAWTANEINNVRDNKASDPTLVHCIKVVGSGDVTIKNVALTEFADSTYCNGGCAYAVLAPATYTGTLTLDNVEIDKFNRTAVNISGGTFEITNCVVNCNATGMGSQFLVFQQPVQFLGDATGRIVDSTVTGFKAAFPAGTSESDLYDAGGIVSWSDGAVAIVDCTVTTDNEHSFGIETDGTGTVTISGTTVEATSAVGYWGDGTAVVINSGDYTGELYGFGNGSLTVNGGTFDQPVPDEFAGSGLWPTVERNGVYTVDTKRTVAFTVDGNAYTNLYVADGDPVAAPTAPTKAADASGVYTFTGWFADGAESAYVFSTPVEDDLALAARFSTTAAKATVIRIVDGTPTNVGYYADLASAVAAAQDGDTVKLLDDVTLTARVEPNVGANTSLTIDLGGYTIARTGTSGNGSAFDVKSGDVVITNGVINCTQPDTDIAADGVYAITSRSGSTVTLADLDITVDSECGACAYPFSGSTMTIESGTYANLTTTPYRYNPAITGMAVNQPNEATQSLIIKGGSFSKYDPQLGDDSGAMTDFTDDGFVAIQDGSGNWVVQPGYNVTFNANGGSPTPDPQRVAADGTATEPTGVTLANHSLRAWKLGDDDYDFDTVLTGDITLVADWTLDQHTVIWVVDGVETTNKVDYGTALSTIQPADPTKAGDDNALYTFTAWSPATTDPVTADATYTAVFKTWNKIAVPTAAPGLVYDGNVQTGVAAGEGYTLSGNTGTDAGSYTATVTLADAENTVWADDTTAPTANAAKSIAWSIGKATVAVPTAVPNLTYDGTEKTGVAAAENGEYTITGNTGTDADDYTATATLTANYDWSDETLTGPQTIDWSIARKAVTVTADNDSKTIGTADPASFSATVDGLIGSDTVSYTVSRTAGETAGTYAITPAGDDVQGNYSVTYVPGTFTINMAYFTVTWKNGEEVLETDENVEYGTTASYNGETPTKESSITTDYTFSGWSPEPGTVTANVTYTALFTESARPYTLTINYVGPAGFPAQETYTAQVTNGTVYTVASPVVAGYTADPATVTGTMPTENVNVTVTYTADAATVMSIALNTPTLNATGVSGKNVTVAAKVGDAELSGPVDVTASPNGTVADAVAGVATATFATNWNAGVEWTLANDTASLPGKSYLKAETAWDATNNTPSAEGEAVRIQMSIEFDPTGPAEAPTVTDGENRGGITVVNGHYMAYNGTTWEQLEGAPVKDGPVDLLMVADMAANTPTVRYYIDGVALYNVSGATTNYAIGLKSGNAYLTRVAFSDVDEEPIVTAEYDVSYVAAIGTTGYTNAAVALAAADTTGVTPFEPLQANLAGGTIELGADDTLVVETAAGYLADGVVVAASGYTLGAETNGTVVTYTVSAPVVEHTGVVSGDVWILDKTDAAANGEQLTFTSIEVDGNQVTVDFTAAIAVEGDDPDDAVLFGIVYKTDLAAAEASKAANAASVTLTKSQGSEVFDGGTAVITLPQGVTDSFFLIGFDSKTED